MDYLKKRKNAFAYAFAGLRQAIQKESHLRIHLLAACLAVGAGWFFTVTVTEWLFLAVCIALVIALELVNSAIERICDLVMPEKHPVIGYVKDISAAAVLVACILALITGLMIFLPYLLRVW